ncbi:hypothetical protein AB0M35_18690 [Micromonospora sp. NPDC051196]|uniref:hypothetical protein n=1 Tax=Micromonospora sp. NPDC051196 TaxID=3155281 RepID=UPI0034319E76
MNAESDFGNACQEIYGKTLSWTMVDFDNDASSCGPVPSAARRWWAGVAPAHHAGSLLSPSP